MDSGLVTCPTCFEEFQVVIPPVTELPAEIDYDCEVCCNPMTILINGDGSPSAISLDDMSS